MMLPAGKHLILKASSVTYRNHREGGVDHSCSDGGIDGLRHTCSLKDPSRVVKHLRGVK